MRAILCERYGRPDEVVHLREVPVPAPAAGEVRIRVHAASVNSWDWDRLTGVPRLYRLMSGLRRPTHVGVGSDYAGRVDAVGPGVQGLAPGDAVFGDLSAHRFAAFADYVCAPVASATPIPEGLDFERAAALPQAGALAIQGARSLDLQAGDEVLINGAGGGAGTLAIQLAVRSGARVTAVDRGEKLALMRSLGAERVIDFAREDFVALPARYDAILDMSCHRPPSDYRRVMKPRGRYAILGGDLGRIAQVGLRSLLQRLAPIGQSMRVVAVRPNVDNRELAERVTRGDLSVVIDQSYPLEAAAEALQRVGDGTAAGKLVIRIAEASPPR